MTLRRLPIRADARREALAAALAAVGARLIVDVGGRVTVHTPSGTRADVLRVLVEHGILPTR